MMHLDIQVDAKHMSHMMMMMTMMKPVDGVYLISPDGL